MTFVSTVQLHRGGPPPFAPLPLVTTLLRTFCYLDSTVEVLTTASLSLSRKAQLNLKVQLQGVA